MINVQHVRFSALTAVLLLSTVTLITIDEGQSSVFAQNVTTTLLPPRLPSQDSTSTPTTSAQDSTSTPTTSPIEPAGSDDESSSSGDDNDNNDDSNDDESSGISGSNDNGDNGDSQDTSDDDGSDSRDTSSNDEEEETEDNFEQTDPLRNQIRNAVIGALSASGIAVP